MLLLLLACTQEPRPRELHAEALAKLEDAPAEAAGICPEIASRPLRADCTWAVVEQLDAEDQDQAEDLCGALQGRNEAECWFLYAEASEQLEACQKAGDFQEDCASHLLGLSAKEWLPKGAKPGEFEEMAQPYVEASGLHPQHHIAWSVLYRQMFRGQQPFDLGSCQGAPDEHRQKICHETGLAFYAQRLTQQHLKGAPLCMGELPERVRYVPHPEVDALLAKKRETELCAPPEGVPRGRRGQ